MRMSLAVVATLFSTMAFASGIEKTAGEMMFEKKISPFPYAAFSGGTGTTPDASGTRETQEALTPYHTLQGDLGFLKLSEIFSIRSVEITEKLGEDTVIKQVYSFTRKENRKSVTSRLQEAIASAKSSVTTRAITACTSGSFWAIDHTWDSKMCHALDHSGNWNMTRYSAWIRGTGKAPDA